MVIPASLMQLDESRWVRLPSSVILSLASNRALLMVEPASTVPTAPNECSRSLVCSRVATHTQVEQGKCRTTVPKSMGSLWWFSLCSMHGTSKGAGAAKGTLKTVPEDTGHAAGNRASRDQ